MSPFEAWRKACEEMNQQVILMEKGESRNGERLGLYVVIRHLPPICETTCNGCEAYFILWFNYEKFQSFVDYQQALITFQNRCKEYVFEDALWD